MDMTETARGAGKLVFAVNGERFELTDVDPSTTLLEFLRNRTRFKSVKLGCGQGGCGACDVLLSKYNPQLGLAEDYKVNSCLALLCSVNGCAITTSEGLGNSKDGFHSIQQRIACFHASQCGFCTPGMCISLFSAIVNAEKGQRSEPPHGFSKLTVSEAETAISGNLCRCTGYRPIADVCKSFAADVDIEDLGFNSLWEKGDAIDVKIGKLPFYDKRELICTYPDFLKSECMPVVLLKQNKISWCSPRTLADLHGLLETHLAENEASVKLVVGNTATGYYKELKFYEKYIDLRHIPELSSIKRDGRQIEIGATVTISRCILALRGGKSGDLWSDGDLVFQKIASHMEKIASESIRNLASVGGNLMMAQRNGFPSDIATILLALDSTVSIITGQKTENLTMKEFLGRPPLDPGSVLLAVQIPCWMPIRDGYTTDSHTKLLFETYRASPRPLGNALPYLNAAFLANVSYCDTGVVVNDIRLAFGAFGAKHAIRASTVENYLVGKKLNIDALYISVKLVEAAVSPEDGTSHSAYRSSLAVSFLFKFLLPLVDEDASVPRGFREVDFHLWDHNGNSSLLSSAKQVVKSSQEYYPVGEAIVKSGAAIQASGEAVFVDDIPSPLNCLYGAFVYSTKPLARVKAVKFKDGSLPGGVDSVFSYKDIPRGGENVGAKTMFGTEPLFATDLTECAGQPLAFVVADTQKNADMAADLAVVDYDTESVGPPLLTVEDAVEKSSFYEVPPFIYPSQVGDSSKGMEDADQKIIGAAIKLRSQYYFYMETQTALAVPDEDSSMVVYSSIQCPEFLHSVISKCLGIPENSVRVITRRVGGGFGGKAIRAMPVATACALAAYNLRRPVRIYLNRKTDMIMAGGRHPMKINYDIGFKSNGKITALHLYILINAGMTADISPVLPHNIVGALKKYNWGALSFDIKVCRTNLSSKSAMRGPGEVQGSFIAEAVLEHVASELSVSVDVVREINLHVFDTLNLFYPGSAGDPEEYTLPDIWTEVARTASFDQRIELIKQFNKSNKWRKRGISRVPIVHEVILRPTPGKVSILWDGSVVVEVGGIELGQGLWTKVKQTTAFALSAVQCDGTEDLVEKVRVIQADTLSLVQGGFTAGSTTSESSCEAVRLCCKILVERLTSLKLSLLKQMDTVTWDTLILQAHFQSINLSASSYFVPDETSVKYLNYGAAVSEVEVNLLTGETTILKTDIIYDCGQSMNPAVDLGQIEGAFVQGIGFFMLEEYLTNSEGLVVSDATWDYKIPTIDTIPKQFNVKVLNSGHHKKRVLSSKASGEPPLLLSASVHCATRDAIKAARDQLRSWGGLDESAATMPQLDVPATMPVVKKLCGLDIVDRYLEKLLSGSSLPEKEDGICNGSK